MVFKKQANEEGIYQDKDGVRYDVLSCERTESMELVQTGTETQEIEGEIVEVPIMEKRVAVNKGWDEYPNLQAALEAYGLTYAPEEL